ncbi:TPA: DUF4446 domain-containing protein [Candidatus Nomurabacteria bacterium]|nr:MAG: hypothetical protein O210_OD1C00001G0380 [Parcubacteria bacterium RAAC4_OD1_1]HCY26387.1 DUF4446 domain-containing protein [Candidatus Nomurabacteria bacterium]
MTISILIYILVVLIIILLVWNTLLERRFKRLFMGTKAKDLEEIMIYLGKQVENIKNSQIDTKKHLNIIDSRLDKTVRNVEMIRFNPFIDAGSNQSFAIAFINDEGDGVVMSSLYARDRMSIFAKPINKGKSTFELSTEEKEVLEKALK